MCSSIYLGDVIWTLKRLILPANWLFALKLLRPSNYETMRALRYWSSMLENTGGFTTKRINNTECVSLSVIKCSCHSIFFSMQKSTCMSQSSLINSEIHRGLLITHGFIELTWWRHQMKTFSASLAFCAGNSPVPGEFPSQRTVTQSFDVFCDLRP